MRYASTRAWCQCLGWQLMSPPQPYGRKWSVFCVYVAARMTVRVQLRTSPEAYMGDLGWRPFWTRAVYQASSSWTRVTEMPCSELTRKTMYVQRNLTQCGASCLLSRLRNGLVNLSCTGREKWLHCASTFDF